MTISNSSFAGSSTGGGSGVGVLTTGGCADRSDEAETARATGTASRLCFSASSFGTWDRSGDLDFEGSLGCRADFREGLFPFGNSDASGRRDAFDLEEGCGLDLVDRGVRVVGLTGS